MNAYLNDENKQKIEHPEIYTSIEKDFQCIFSEFLLENKIENFKHIPNLMKGKKNKDSGDLSSNICIHLAKETKNSATDLATLFAKKLGKISEKYSQVTRIETSKFGHINIFIKQNKEKKKEKIETKKELTLKFQKSEFFKEEFEIFKKYQTKIHLEDPNEVKESSFISNFCKNSINYEKSPFDIDYGCYHLQYLLNNKIIAVSIIDIVTYGINCAYHFYDTDYSFLSIGIYSAIGEIKLIQSFSKIDSRFQYYYLGTYVHNCPKVNYKVQYQKSELLCSESKVWIDFKKASKILDEKKDDPALLEYEKEVIKKEHQDLLYLFNSEKFNGFYGSDGMKEKLKSKVHDNINDYFDILGPHLARKLVYFIRDEDLIEFKEKIDENSMDSKINDEQIDENSKDSK